MTDSPCKHEGSAVLLVEGANDCHVVLALCNKFAVPETFGVYDCGCDSKALQRLNALISSSVPPQAIGLVLDADDTGVDGRWRQICGKLSHYDYVLPGTPAPDGTVLGPVNELPRLGFWLMPNNCDSGMLEDFCLEMIEFVAVAATRECVELARSKGITTFREEHYSKAVVHTYLALQDEPGRPLGQSITAETLRVDTPTARVFVAWLNRLFGNS